jgi:hypothetical protein
MKPEQTITNVIIISIGIIRFFAHQMSTIVLHYFSEYDS